jgi:hypothetical protein
MVMHGRVTTSPKMRKLHLIDATNLVVGSPSKHGLLIDANVLVAKKSIRMSEISVKLMSGVAIQRR